MTVSMDEQAASSLHSWWANKQLRMALAGWLWCRPTNIDKQAKANI